MKDLAYISAHFAPARLSGQPSSARELRFYRDPAESVRFESERGKGMTDKELDNYCWAWNHWCRTRKFYIAPGAKNILARMQPARVKLPPNALVSADLSFFNMAVHALADMNDPDLECFVKYYVECVGNIKVVADELKIHRDTFYERKRRFARRAFSMSASLKNAHALAMSAEVSQAEID